MSQGDWYKGLLPEEVNQNGNVWRV